MHVEAVEEHERGARTAARGLVPWLMSLPRNYPVSWAIAWTVLLLGLILAPSRVLPDEKTFSTKESSLRPDLLIHFTLFVGFAWSWIRATRSPWRWVAVTAAGLFLAIGTEWTQGFSILDRDPEVADGLADCAGVAVGLAGAARFGRPPIVHETAGRTDLS